MWPGNEATGSPLVYRARPSRELLPVFFQEGRERVLSHVHPDGLTFRSGLVLRGKLMLSASYVQMDILRQLPGLLELATPHAQLTSHLCRPVPHNTDVHAEVVFLRSLGVKQ